MEYFTGLVKRMYKKDPFSFHYHSKQLRLTHSIFVDDLMLFRKGDLHFTVLFMRTLKSYAQALGLNASPKTSAIYHGNMKEDIQRRYFRLPKLEKECFLLDMLGLQLPLRELVRLSVTY